MREVYHEQLDATSDLLVEMTRLNAVAIKHATRALVDADVALADQVIADKVLLDTAYREVEDRVLDILARQQPVASDLRLLVASMRIVSDLERNGDLATHIASIARQRFPRSTVPAELRAHIARMGDVCEFMVTKAGQVIVERDPDLAQEVATDDDVMDDLHRTLLQTLVNPGWSHGVDTAIDLALVGRFLERFCDHAVAVALRVIFLVRGVEYTESSISGH